MSRHAFRSCATFVAHVARQLVFVAGSFMKHVASVVAHFVAHLTPVPGAKQFPYAVSNGVKQPTPPPP